MPTFRCSLRSLPGSVNFDGRVRGLRKCPVGRAGAAMSPLLANAFLHYADDIVAGFKQEGEARCFQDSLRVRFVHFVLELNGARPCACKRKACVRRTGSGETRRQVFAGRPSPSFLPIREHGSNDLRFDQGDALHWQLNLVVAPFSLGCRQNLVDHRLRKLPHEEGSQCI